MMQNKSDSERPLLTIIENDGPRLFVPPPPSKTSQSPQQSKSPFGCSGACFPTNAPTQPSLAPGDDANPNNYLPLSFANSFACPASIILGSKSLIDKKHILPKSISLATTLANNGNDGYHVLHELRISFQNDLQETAAALLSIPRLPNMLLLEEEHECGGIKYKPKVEEKELAQFQYQQAASSQDKTATLTDIGSDAHHIKLDKVPAGANGVFVVRFLQVGGLKTRGEVSSSVQEEEVQQQGSDGTKWTKRSIADIVILPGFTCLDCPGGGVPFDYALSFENDVSADAKQIISVELPEAEVMAKDLEDAGRNYAGMHSSKNDILFIVQLAPSLLSEKKDKNAITSTLTWKSLAGLARGTLLKIRLVHTKSRGNIFLSDSKLTMHPPPPSSSPEFLSDMVQNVDTIPRIIHDMQSGIKCDSSLLDLEIPVSLPLSLSFPSKHQHELYIIVDTSGSTMMHSGEGGQTFLETAKSLIDGILLDLPSRIRYLKSMCAIDDSLPISVKLWSFNNDTTFEAEAMIESSKGASVVEPLRTRVSQMRSGGVTNYDSWAAKLQSMVSANPSNLHSVLLITDGGATHRQRFFDAIDSISSSSLSAGGFFQVDSLGYGPWLDPECVSYLSARTGGEALMVESLDGRGTRQKILSILAKSLVRAASKLSLRIENAKLLAMSHSGGEAGEEEGGNFCSPVETMFPSPCLRVYPGQKLRMVLLHPSDSAPQLKIQAGDESNFAVIPFKQADGWEIVTPPSAQVTKEMPLCHPNAVRALRHLPMLEPAYARPGSVHHPPSTATDRTAVTLTTSILGQIVAPSVTKSIAVVELDNANHFEPVPEHHRPESVSFKELYPTNFRFYGEMDHASSTFGPFGGSSAGGFGGFSSTSANVSGSPFGSPAPVPGGVFGSPAPAGMNAFGAPAPSPARSNLFDASAAAPLGGSPFSAPAPAAAGFGFGAPTSQQHTDSVGFKVTKPSLGEKNSVPGIIDWIHSTRGGIYPADARRFKSRAFSSSGEGKRLTKETLRDYLRNYTSLPNSQLLRAIECTIALFPNKTGPLSSFDQWVSKHKSDISALTSVGLVCQDIVSAGGLALHSSPVFPWQASDVGKISAKDVVGRKGNAEKAEERKKFLSVINASVRRDVYNVLINPTHPNKGAEPSSMKSDGSIPFGAALLAKASGGKEIDTFAFVDRETVVGSLPEDYQVLNDSNVIDAISNMGSAHPCALAVLETFEDYLKGKAENWTDEDISLLSVEFLVAFGRELSPRLDVHHRIRSKKLSKDEILLLRNEPYALYVNQDMIRAFQDESTWVYEKLSK